MPVVRVSNSVIPSPLLPPLPLLALTDFAGRESAGLYRDHLKSIDRSKVKDQAQGYSGECATQYSTKTRIYRCVLLFFSSLFPRLDSVATPAGCGQMQR